MEQEIKSVGEEFIEWANREWMLDECISRFNFADHTSDILQAMEDHINIQIENRINKLIAK